MNLRFRLERALKEVRRLAPEPPREYKVEILTPPEDLTQAEYLEWAAQVEANCRAGGIELITFNLPPLLGRSRGGDGVGE